MKIDMVKEELKNRIGDFVQDEAKAATVVWLKDKALPAVQDVADAYTAALKASAADETGWCKFRDAIFLPGLVDAALWLTGKALGEMAERQG